MLRLKPTPEYESAKAALSRTAQRALDIVESGISQDPYHTIRRHLRNDGVTVDLSGEGLFVAFRVRGEVVELLEVIDLKNAPRWP